MIAIPAGARIVVASEPLDFRKGMDGLAAAVQGHLARNPFGGDIFIFRSKRADRLKILFWDGSGLCLFHKRLEEGRFVWPPIRSGTVTLTRAQLSMLLDGLDWSKVRPLVVRQPATAC